MTGRALLLLLLLAGCANAPQGNAYQRGVDALAKGDARTARVELLNALKQNPNDRKARLLQARTYLELGDGVAAQAEAERAGTLGAPRSATAPLVAHALMLQGRAEAALAALGNEHGAYAERMRGRALAAMGRNAEAGAAYDHARALAPKDDDLLTDIARFRRASGEIAGALAAADAAVAANPQNGEALVLRGELTRGQYGLRAALPWFDRAIALDDDNITARLERAATLGDLGAMHAMLAETRKVLARAPDHPMAYYLQAMLAARARDFGLARSLYQRTRGQFDAQPAAMLLRGAIEFAAGDAREAVEWLGQLVELQPDNIKARRMLAAAQWKSGDAAATVKTLRDLADREDADSYTLSLIGAALAKLGDREAASRYLGRAAWPDRRAPTALFDQALGAAAIEAASVEASASPGDAGAQVRLIRALIAGGDFGQAQARAARLAADNPGAPDAHLLLGDTLAMQGDYKGAAERYRRAANIAFTEPAAMRMIEALERSGQSEAAGQVLELFLDQNPRSIPAQLLAAGRLMQARQWEDAVEAYEGLRAQIGDSDAAMLNNLAQAYAQLGDYDSAIPIAHRAWRLDKGNSMAADTYGWLLYRSGRDRARGLVLMQQASRGGASEETIRRRLEASRARKRS